MSVSIVAMCVFGVFVGAGVSRVRRYRWMTRVTPVPVEVELSFRDMCGRLPLTVDEAALRLGEMSGPPRGCFGNDAYRAVYCRKDSRRAYGHLVETIRVTHSNSGEGNFTVTFRDGHIVAWMESYMLGRRLTAETTTALGETLIRLRAMFGF